jgi:hypothetical protein
MSLRLGLFWIEGMRDDSDGIWATAAPLETNRPNMALGKIARATPLRPMPCR